MTTVDGLFGLIDFLEEKQINSRSILSITHKKNTAIIDIIKLMASSKPDRLARGDYTIFSENLIFFLSLS